MAWMIVHREVNWSRPRSIYSFNAKPAPVPQEFPHDFVDHAVATGRAERVAAPSSAAKKALRRATQRAK